ncbi:unnamed protein product [Rhizoctonia solani]|uniref:Intradiol ring-cleavage dioxygenases domain-containing protein n=1 Tax=Rhizoctonia solani TaxID=456999 RepID=A0A8H3HEW1_9AGAM|nr:unnamed protein product [Rhizoctonia solani]
MYTLNLARLGLGLLALSGLAFAHPEDDEVVHPYDVARRQLEANDRHVATSKCARQIAEYNSARRMKRSLSTSSTKREVKEVPGSSYEIPKKNQPTYKTIQNNTCIVAPEVTEGPYFVQNELLRNDIREDQGGVDLFLDIGVMDIRTCKPLPRALVEIWSCNATGFYSTFTMAPPAIGDTLPASTDSLYTNSATRSAIIEAGMQNVTGDKTDEMTWLRGAYPTNDNGLVEFKTKYPGYYTGRAIHIHTIITTNWTYLTNGTVVSKSGNTRHIGQMFFAEELSDKVLATPAYQNSTQVRLENYRDSILAVQNSQGHNAFVDPVLMGDSVEAGVLAYITIGVDTNFETGIYTNNTWEPTKAAPGSSPYGPKATSANKRTPIAY